MLHWMCNYVNVEGYEKSRWIVYKVLMWWTSCLGGFLCTNTPSGAENNSTISIQQSLSMFHHPPNTQFLLCWVTLVFPLKPSWGQLCLSRRQHRVNRVDSETRQRPPKTWRTNLENYTTTDDVTRINLSVTNDRWEQNMYALYPISRVDGIRTNLDLMGNLATSSQSTVQTRSQIWLHNIEALVLFWR